MNGSGFHLPVLCSEALRFLLTENEGTYVDGTLGAGGHAEGICASLQGAGRLIGFDVDEDSLGIARTRLAPCIDRVTIVRANFMALRAELAMLGIDRINGLLLDLGVSSLQFDRGGRGFSYRSDAPLDMRMDQRQVLTAQDVVNEYSEKDLANILQEYGEERHSRRLARRIVRERPVSSTGELAAIVGSVAGGRFLKKSLSRVFQAVRIEVNQELVNLQAVLQDVPDLLVSGGRVVIISYHSLEDRIVKNVFRRFAERKVGGVGTSTQGSFLEPSLAILTKKPVVAAAVEREQNPRARSAKMRVAERTA